MPIFCLASCQKTAVPGKISGVLPRSRHHLTPLRHLGKSFDRPVCHQRKRKGSSLLQQNLGSCSLSGVMFFKPIGRRSFSICILLFRCCTKLYTRSQERRQRSSPSYSLVAKERLASSSFLSSRRPSRSTSRASRPHTGSSRSGSSRSQVPLAIHLALGGTLQAAGISRKVAHTICSEQEKLNGRFV